MENGKGFFFVANSRRLPSARIKNQESEEAAAAAPHATTKKKEKGEEGRCPLSRSFLNPLFSPSISHMCKKKEKFRGGRGGGGKEEIKKEKKNMGFNCILGVGGNGRGEKERKRMRNAIRTLDN